MSESEPSDSSESSSESEEEIETPNKSNVKSQTNKMKISDYEQQRLNRIEENKARMKALGLKTMVKSMIGTSQKPTKLSENKKGKRKIGHDDDDEDYKPVDDEDDDEEEDPKDTPYYKEKQKTTPQKKPLPKKRATNRKSDGYPNYVDDDDALLQAISLSLQDSSGFLNISQSSSSQIKESTSNVNTENIQIQEDIEKKKMIKKKKMINNRVQMTEDEVILHFFQFDEAGEGKISWRDIQRLADAHDFTWSDKEMEDMINCFDTDKDGKLSLDDFRKIMSRCNLIKVPEK